MLDERQLLIGLRKIIRREEISESKLNDIAKQINQFAELVQKWNRTHNLTSITEPDAFLSKHIFDSLTLVQPLSVLQPVLQQKAPLRLLDIGSGAGFPSIPLSIVDHNLQIVSIDASQKRIAFQRQVIRELGLDNIEANHVRVEDAKTADFDVITCRAFADIKTIVSSSRHLLNQRGQWLIMKGQYPDLELAELEGSELSANIEIKSVEAVDLEGLAAARHIVHLGFRD